MESMRRRELHKKLRQLSLEFGRTLCVASDTPPYPYEVKRAAWKRHHEVDRQWCAARGELDALQSQEARRIHARHPGAIIVWWGSGTMLDA